MVLCFFPAMRILKRRSEYWPSLSSKAVLSIALVGMDMNNRLEDISGVLIRS